MGWVFGWLGRGCSHAWDGVCWLLDGLVVWLVVWLAGWLGCWVLVGFFGAFRSEVGDVLVCWLIDWLLD